MQRTGRAALISAASSAALAVAMIVIATVSGSIAVLAEGVDTIVDTVTSLALFIGLKLSGRHTKNFPFGLHKLENLIATGIGFIILISAYELARQSILRIIEGTTGSIVKPGLVLIVMAVAAAVKGLNAWYKRRVARMENSPGLAADARHSLADLAGVLAVILGVGLATLGVLHMDAAAALVVVLFLFWAGISVTFDGIKVLLDASVQPEILARARRIAEEHHGVKKVLKVEGRNSGRYRFLHLSLEPRTPNLSQASHVVQEIEDSIRNEIRNLDRVTIDLVAEEKKTIMCAVPIEGNGISLSLHFGNAPSFVLLEINPLTGEVIAREHLANPFIRLVKAKGLRAAEFLAGQGVDLLLVRQSLEGTGPHYALDAQGIVEIVRPQIANLGEAEKELSEFVRKTYS
jgi:cation diffusion facilitator family transporter